MDKAKYLDSSTRYWLQTVGCFSFIPVLMLIWALAFLQVPPATSEVITFPLFFVVAAGFIYLLVDLFLDDLTRTEKFTWFIVLFCLSIIGFVIYWFYRVNRKKRFI